MDKNTFLDAAILLCEKEGGNDLRHDIIRQFEKVGAIDPAAAYQARKLQINREINRGTDYADQLRSLVGMDQFRQAMDGDFSAGMKVFPNQV